MQASSASASGSKGHSQSQGLGQSQGLSEAGTVLPSSSSDCDSEELELLEEAAQEEIESDTEFNRVLDEAAALYPPADVARLTTELKSSGLVSFVQKHLVGKTRADIKALLVAFDVLLPRSIRDDDEIPLGTLVSILKTALMRRLRMRDKLPQYNTVDDALALLKNSRRIVVLTGAGISTSCGVPDFRSPDGLYAQLEQSNKYPELTDPTDMFHKDFFLSNPSLFFHFAKDIFPSNFVPSPSHRFIKLLQDRGQLLRQYTQNIDTIEKAAGIDKVLYCHGSFSSAKCTLESCGYEAPGSSIKDDIMAQRVPNCPRCQEREVAARKAEAKLGRRGKRWNDGDDDEYDDESLPGLSVMKPTIVFFGEKLSSDFDQALLDDREEVDLLVIMGTTLKVAPVSEIVAHVPHTTPILLINRTPILHYNIDVQLLGNADGIVEYLCARLGWTLPSPAPEEDVVGPNSIAKEVAKEESPLRAVASKETGISSQPECLGDSHFWLFKGAEVPDRLVKALNGQDSDGENDDQMTREYGEVLESSQAQEVNGESGDETSHQEDERMVKRTRLA